MQRNHRDRPGVRLTAEERRRFSEIALQLRYELDGLTFPDLTEPTRHLVGRRRVSATLARGAGRATGAIAGLSRRVATPFVLALIGIGAVTAAALTAGDLRFACTTIGSFVLAWATTLAALQISRRAYARRTRARLRHQHQT